MHNNLYARFAAAFVVTGALTVASVQAAGEHVSPATEFAKTTVAKWVSSPEIIKAINAQNVRHSVLTQEQIDTLDKQWRAEVGASSRPLIDEVLSRPASRFLAEMKDERGGQVLEIFVMDNRGLNVAQSDVTSDYWQGDEAKWKKTYSRRPRRGVRRRSGVGRVFANLPGPNQHVH